MKAETIPNLLSEHRLSDSSLAFLETIKFHSYQLETPEAFEIISYVNKSEEIAKQIFESYYEVGFCETYNLKSPETSSDNFKNLNEIINNRKSTREFSSVPISLENLSAFLQLLYCVTGEELKTLKSETIVRKTRSVGSGGSMYPTEIFVINNRIDEIPKGAFHYNVHNFQLELLKKIDTNEELDFLHKILMKSDVKNTTTDFENASAFIVFTAVLNKHSFKYGDFGLALSLIEIGEFIHAGYLACSALGLACCSYGSMLNDRMSEYLDLRNPLHLPLTYMAIGNM